MRVPAIVAAAALVGALGGCAGLPPDLDAAENVALEFHQAVSESDAAAACALLAPRTIEELEQQAGTECVEALADLDLPGGTEVVDGAAYGLAAQVTLGDDTVFLSLMPSGWLVTAAGCTAVPEQPYRCDLKGG